MPRIGNHQPHAPYAYRALDLVRAHLLSGAPLPADADIHPRLRQRGEAGLAPLTAAQLDMP